MKRQFPWQPCVRWTDALGPNCFALIFWIQEISNRTHVSRTPKKPEYLIARSQLTWGSVGKVQFNFWWTHAILVCHCDLDVPLLGSFVRHLFPYVEVDNANVWWLEPLGVSSYEWCDLLPALPWTVELRPAKDCCDPCLIGLCPGFFFWKDCLSFRGWCVKNNEDSQDYPERLV